MFFILSAAKLPLTRATCGRTGGKLIEARGKSSNNRGRSMREKLRKGGTSITFQGERPTPGQKGNIQKKSRRAQNLVKTNKRGERRGSSHAKEVFHTSPRARTEVEDDLSQHKKRELTPCVRKRISITTLGVGRLRFFFHRRGQNLL